MTLAFVGDGNNVAHSLLLGASLTGMNFRIASPTGYAVQDRILHLAQDYAIPLPPDLKQRADQIASDASGPITTLISCTSCAWDISSCQTLGQIASCALPVEMTPLGDLNALRRAGVDWATGNNIDKLDVGLALVGLSATTATLVKGGTSYTLKVGETVLRAGRRMGAINSKFMDVLAQAANIPVNWAHIPPYIIGKTPFDQVVNPKHITQLSSLVADIGIVRKNTSLTETIILLKYVDGAEDARRLARLSDVSEAETFRTLYVLGKQKSFRLLLKLSRITKIAIGLAFILIAQFFGLFAGQILRILKRIVKSNPRR